MALGWLWVPNRLPTACLANGFEVALRWIWVALGGLIPPAADHRKLGHSGRGSLSARRNPRGSWPFQSPTIGLAYGIQAPQAAPLTRRTSRPLMADRPAVVPEQTGWPFGLRVSGANSELEIANEGTHTGAQRPSNLQQIIQGGGFLPPFNSANEHRGEVGFLGQLLLTESCLFACGTNCLTQKAAVLLNGQHHRLKSKNHEKPPCR